MPVYGPPEAELNQGDVLEDVPFLARRLHDVEHRPLAGLITSHSCDIDKFDELRQSLRRNERLSWPVRVAPLYGLHALPPGPAGNVRSGGLRRYFYLPAEAPHPEMMADMWFEQPVPIVLVVRLNRVATLSPEWLAKLWQHVFVSVSRRDPRDVFVEGRLSAP